MSLVLHELIGAHPSGLAVRCGDRRVSYAELDVAANRLAHHLQAHGSGPETVTAICLPRAPELLVAIVAALKAGSAYLPIDPRTPVERVGRVLRRARPKIFLTDDDTVEVPGARVVNVIDRAIGDQSSMAPTARVRPDNLAYVLNTSGSTGEPKVVALTHRAATNYLRYLGDRWGLGPGDVALQLASLGYSAGVRDLLGPLVNGATVELVPDEGARSVERVAERLAGGGVSCLLSCLPRVASALLDLGAPPGDLRLVMLISETFGPQLAQRIRRQWGDSVQIVHQYGLTECAMTSLSSAITADEAGADRLPLDPIANTEIHILDEQSRAVSPGGTGELHIGGSGLARGYHDDPAMTAQQFVPNPFGVGARLFRTGDLARGCADGTIELLGRRDRQVKVRGHRIELDEVEVALRTHPAVRGGAVEAHQRNGDTSLVAYVVSATPAPTDLDLREHLARSLPDHMVPIQYVRLPDLPVLPNGKIDRGALLPPASGIPDSAVGDQTEAEQQLGRLWQEILDVAAIRTDDDFFALGGHSLHVIRLTARVRHELGVPLTVEDVFANRTLSTLAQCLQSCPGREEQVQPRPERMARDQPLPLTPAQRSLWFLDRLRPGTATYTIAFSLRIDGPVDVDHLCDAVQRVVSRQEALRTTFEDRGGEPVAVVHPEARFDLTVAEGSAAADIAARTEVPFDLARGPLLRLTVWVSPESSVVLVEVHHIVADDWSVGIFLADLAAAYQAEEPVPLSVQFADLHLRSAGAEASRLAFWRDRLAGCPPLTQLPTDHPRPAVASDEGGAIWRTLPSHLVSSLESLARSSGTTPYMVVLAAWAALIARWSGQDDVVLGALTAGRHEPAADGLIGLFVNTVPVRLRVVGDASFSDLLGEVRTALVAALDNEVPFERVVEHVGPERSPAYAPLVQVTCDWRDEAADELDLGGSRARLEDVETQTAKYDLWLSHRRRGGVVRMRIEYRSDLFSAETAERLMDRVEMFLASVTADPDRPVAAGDLLPAPERQRMLVEWNDTARSVDDRLLHELVNGEGDAVAVRAGDRSLTYSELDAMSRSLADRLRACGCGSEALVAICLPRRADLVVSLIGALKAGSGFLPLDPRYPVPRLDQMLDLARPAVLLTTTEIADQLAVPTTTRVLALDRLGSAVTGATPPLAPARPGNVAYVLFTSGSTGVPKGVALTHRGAVNLVRWSQEEFSPSELAVVAATTSVCFDLSVFEIFSPLSVGGTVELLDDLLSLSGHAAAKRVTLINTVPSALSALLDATPALPRLRRVNVAGEQLRADLVDQVGRQLPGCRVTNLYGPTETTTYSTAGACVPGDRVTIGGPITNTQVYLLDEHRQPVAPGTPGEIHIGGLGVARGYHRRPAASAERFLPNPFAEGGRMYRTGDLARYRVDGTIEFLGRTDRQVKVRGHRIEPGEVETALHRHPQVRRAVVATRPDSSGDARLVAWVVAEGTVTGTELRSALAGQLAGYLVPSIVMLVESLPLTPNGKIDQAALPNPQPQVAPAPAALSLAAETLAAIWCGLLGVARVDPGDDFFSIGGHSLLATRLVNRIDATFQIELAVREVFESPRLADMARRIEDAVVRDIIRRGAADREER